MICSILIAYLYPLPILPSPPWWEYVTVFSAAEIVFWGTAYGILVASGWVRRLWRQFIIPVPLVMFLSIFATLLFARIYNPIMAGPVWSEFSPLQEEVVLVYVVILGFEIVYSIFVLPHTRFYGGLMRLPPAGPVALDPAPPPPALLAENRTTPPSSPPQKPQAEPAKPPPRHVHFGSHSWPVSALRLIRAEEHYIRVVTDHQEVLIRYRLSDAVSQLPEDAGMRVHRSYWLSYDAIVQRAPLPDSRLLLTLWNGTTVTVPRAHRKKLEAAFAARPCPADPAKGG
ncbi:LytTR family DNA-binding domain-containing protein [Paracoccus thiocyanatus]|nr:LytTR family DNA-binding domain-containing protein [Paracoccus thiocyanatus]